jgi:acetyl esterase/lipase
MSFAKETNLLPRWASMGLLAAASLTAAEYDVEPRVPQSMERFAKAPAGTVWVRAGLNTNRPIWGIRGGLLWGLPPATGQPADGPRGLIRLRYPVLPGGVYDLINFIAVEPVVRGQRGFSELEPSQLDGVPGKRFRATEPNTSIGQVTNLMAGQLTKLDAGAERLTVEVAVERFENGAHVTLILSQCSDAPDELELIVHLEPDSAPIEYCILTATMGNKTRARQLWLKDGAVSSLSLYKDYKDSGFTTHRLYSLNRLRRTASGDILTAITTDEADPATVDSSPAAAHWRYGGFPVTQYWRKPAGAWRDDLHVAVNARYTYWMSHHPIPGGVAFENFELRERFYQDQRFVFGIIRRTPKELGFSIPSNESRAELAKWDDAAKHRSQTGPGGTEWDAPYRSLIQTDESATSKGLPTHAEAAKQILADAARNAGNLCRHQGWILYIKHFSQAYRPDSASSDLKRLYEELVALNTGAPNVTAKVPFERDERLITHCDVIYGRSHPEIQKLDAYLVKSSQLAPVVIEIHGGGWRRGSKSQFVYAGDLIRAILDAGISVISIDYRLTPQFQMPTQMEDVARAVQFVRSKTKAWNLDPNRIAALGGSAGAHLAAWVALHDDLAKPESPDPVERLSSRLACFVALSGPMDLTRIRPTELARQPLRGQDFANAFTAAFGCSAEQFESDSTVRQRIREASPLFLVSRDDPPAFLMGAWNENLAVLSNPPVPAVINDPHSAWHSVLLAEAMRKVGAKTTCRVGPEVGRSPEADNEGILEFLRENFHVNERSSVP